MASPSRSLPTMVIFGEKGRLIINVKDYETWKKKGYVSEEDRSKEETPKRRGRKPKTILTPETDTE